MTSTTQHRRTVATAVVCLVTVLVGCASHTAASPSTTKTSEAPVAGDIPDDQAFVTYDAGGYTIKVPEGWARSTVGAATEFTDKYNRIRIETMPLGAEPTPASVAGGDLLAIARSAKGYRAGDLTSVARKAGSAILATYQMDGAGNGVTDKVVRLDVERYEFWKNGKAAIVTLSSAAGSDNVDPWRTVTDSFAWSS